MPDVRFDRRKHEIRTVFRHALPGALTKFQAIWM
jgi:hypothetical protein